MREFCIDNICDAAGRGACCANYCQVTGFQAEGDRLIAAHVRDRLGGGEFDIAQDVYQRGRALGRACGRADDPFVRSPSSAQRNQGAHILVPRLTQTHGIFFQARGDGRMMFVLPWNDCTLVGTTDTDFQGNPADVRAMSPMWSIC